jgi:hypothetical protein
MICKFSAIVEIVVSSISFIFSNCSGMLYPLFCWSNLLKRLDYTLMDKVYVFDHMF